MSTTTDVLSLFKYDPVADADSTFNITQALNNNWDKLDAAILLAIAAAGAYNPEESYAVGDYCTYKGKLHKCSTAIPTGETWTEAHWTTTTVAAELAELSSQLSNLESTLTTPPQEFDLPLMEGVSPPAKYCKTQFGMVWVYINVLKPDNGTFSNGEQIGTLPAGFRPAYSIYVPAVVCITGGSVREMGEIAIFNDGRVAFYHPPEATATNLIRGIALFRAAS